MDKSALTAAIRGEAARLGFFSLGIARAESLPACERLDRWLQEGMHGEMRYMARQAAKRKDPDLVLPEVRSIITLAAGYYAGREPEADATAARISRYAAGEDYHHVLEKRLRELAGHITGLLPEAGVRTYVDTGPVMEKSWGAEGGLGWVGKHSNLIIRQQGSWFFIGTILLAAELDYGTREPDRCGTCRRCITACPTGAIVQPYVVDARLCISYLTIELRGSIPRALRPLIGNRVFGCDDCQDVCPWNRFAVRTPFGEFLPREGIGATPLLSLIQLTAEQFRLRFAGTAILRAGRDGFVRNVAVALGNSRSLHAVDALAISVRDESALVRAHAAWALGRIGGAAARNILADAFVAEDAREVREEIELALAAANAPGLNLPERPRRGEHAD
jgi:epoxyqueuosine reductase